MNKKILSLLTTLEKTRTEYWNITRETGLFIQALILDRKYKTAIEIGTSNGYSALHLASALSQNKGHLYTIESNAKKRFPLAQKTIKESGLKNITLILGHAPEAISKTPQKFDLAFFDATKCEHLSYFKALAPRIKKGGMIITDNINSHKKELADYLRHAKSQKDWISEEVAIGTGLLISVKA